jgi:CheY-like chemotaxis protein
MNENATPKILVVDDSSNERNGLCRLLERAGYEVRSAFDGIEALQKIRENEFDLLLIDVWMPRLNGLELLARLPENSRPRALIITGDESPDIFVRSLREKAYRFITKPIKPDELLLLVRNTLELPPGPDPIEVVSAESNWVELRFPCAIQAADRIEHFVDQLNYGLTQEVRQAVKMALHELLVNAVKWGGRCGPGAHAEIEYLRTRKFVMCRIADPGAGFNASDWQYAALNSQTSKQVAMDHSYPYGGFRPEGFGMKLAKTLVDELVYNEAHNEVAMVKYLH